MSDSIIDGQAFILSEGNDNRDKLSQENWADITTSFM